MNKGELIEAIAKVTCTKAEAAKALDTTLDAIKKSLKKGKSRMFPCLVGQRFS